MLENLRQLPKYRGLIQSLVARELKARYRGSVLGFFWSFFNPLLLLLVYTFVFTVVLPAAGMRSSPTARCFCSAAFCPGPGSPARSIESSNVLIAGGNLIKKVMFPAEILPIVSVLSNLVHFLFGLIILVVFLIYYQRAAAALRARLVSGRGARAAAADAGARADSVGPDRALPRHQGHSRERADALVFRDADHLSDVAADGPASHPGLGEAAAQPEPVHAPGDLLSGDPVLSRARSVTGSGCSRSASARSVLFLFGYFLFDRLRDSFAEEV